MSFISAGFFMAMALTACLYYLIPKKYQWELLLFVSFGFYATYGIRYMGYILFTIITSYCITRLMAAQKEKLMRRRWLIFGLVSNFGILVFLKYVNFTILNLTSLFSVFHQAFPLGKLSIVMPLGISFYTFQTMSYVIDVYQKKYEPETNIFRLALFTAYLPQLLQGPIGRYDRLAPQLFEPHDFNLKNIEYGAQRIAWGLAKKLILADRAYVFSKAVFADLNTYSGMYVIVALLTFSIYEYCDFSGGIDVVIGVSELFGIRLDEYNGLIIAASNLLKPYYAKWAAVCHVNTESRGWKTFQIFRTFILVNIGWLFDACATATTAFYAMRAVFINFKISILTDGSLYKLGLVKRDWTILIVATIILFISSVMKEKGMSLRDFVAERPLVVRWAVYLILIFATAPFGYVSSSTEFMYAQF